MAGEQLGSGPKAGPRVSEPSVTVSLPGNLRGPPCVQLGERVEPSRLAIFIRYGLRYARVWGCQERVLEGPDRHAPLCSVSIRRSAEVGEIDKLENSRPIDHLKREDDHHPCRFTRLRASAAYARARHRAAKEDQVPTRIPAHRTSARPASPPWASLLSSGQCLRLGPDVDPADDRRHRWLSRKYPKIVQPVIEDDPSRIEVDGGQFGPRDSGGRHQTS